METFPRIRLSTLSNLFGQASNILQRQGGYLFIDGVRILSWIDEPQIIEFTMKIRNVNPKFHGKYYETYGTSTKVLSGVFSEAGRGLGWLGP
jgi:hypothetical protein